MDKYKDKKHLPKSFDQCPIHTESELSKIDLQDCGKDLIFKCKKCEQSNQIIEINEIAFSSIDPLSTNYPILSDHLKQQIKQNFELAKSKQNMDEYVKTFMKNLRIHILQSLSIMEEDLLKKSKEVAEFQIKFLEEYNNMSRKQELRNVIFDESLIEDKSNSAKIIFQDVASKSDQIEQKLKQIIGRYNKTLNCFKPERLYYNSQQMIESQIKAAQKQSRQKKHIFQKQQVLNKSFF